MAEKKSTGFDQVEFLVCCIRNASAGKPDFDAVATDLGIVSKAAAQKRYERLLKSNNIGGTKTPATPTASDTAPTPKTRTTGGRKRATTAGDDQQESPTKKRGSRAKPKPKAMKEESENEDEKPAKDEAPSTPRAANDVKKDEETETSALSDIPTERDEVEI